MILVSWLLLGLGLLVFGYVWIWRWFGCLVVAYVWWFWWLFCCGCLREGVVVLVICGCSGLGCFGLYVLSAGCLGFPLGCVSLF